MAFYSIDKRRGLINTDLLGGWLALEEVHRRIKQSFKNNNDKKLRRWGGLARCSTPSVEGVPSTKAYRNNHLPRGLNLFMEALFFLVFIRHFSRFMLKNKCYLYYTRYGTLTTCDLLSFFIIIFVSKLNRMFGGCVVMNFIFN